MRYITSCIWGAHAARDGTIGKTRWVAFAWIVRKMVGLGAGGGLTQVTQPQA